MIETDWLILEFTENENVVSVNEILDKSIHKTMKITRKINLNFSDGKTNLLTILQQDLNSSK